MAEQEGVAQGEGLVRVMSNQDLNSMLGLLNNTRAKACGAGSGSLSSRAASAGGSTAGGRRLVESSVQSARGVSTAPTAPPARPDGTSAKPPRPQPPQRPHHSHEAPNSPVAVATTGPSLVDSKLHAEKVCENNPLPKSVYEMRRALSAATVNTATSTNDLTVF